MVCASPDATRRDDEALRASRIAERTDARCLALSLVWLRRTYLLAPFGLFGLFMGVQLGAPVLSSVWFGLWTAHQVFVYLLAGRLQSQPATSPAVGLAYITWAFATGGVLVTCMLTLLVLLSPSTDILLLITLAVSLTAGASITSAVGLTRVYVIYAGPAYIVTIGAWLWHGGAMGYLLALLFATALPVSLWAVRFQRRGLAELVRLLDENEALAEAVTHERDRARAASESKTRFFAAASHDLRQPLHALSINATTLDLLARRSTVQVLRELSEGIGSALQQSRALLDGLLDISRLDAQAVQTRIVACDVAALLRAVRREYAALAARRGLALEVAVEDGVPSVLTDSDQFVRIIGNLVDNAIKFTREGRVLLSAQLDGAGRVLVRVMDTGPGISADERERVFEEFYQVGNPSRDRSKGLGLGLAIVRRTAALLDIGLTLESEQGRGTTFELRLPCATTQPVGEAPVASDIPLRPALSVLLVDDEPEVLAAMCAYLRQIGWSARGVANGEQAQQAVNEGFRADVLAVDFRLREETGVQVIERLRRQRPDLPAVIVTGDTAPSRLIEFAGLAASVLNKPVDGVKLARALEHAVGR